jgi:hypothetical protein
VGHGGGICGLRLYGLRIGRSGGVGVHIFPTERPALYVRAPYNFSLSRFPSKSIVHHETVLQPWDEVHLPRITRKPTDSYP